MWDLIVSVPDHCLSFYFPKRDQDKRSEARRRRKLQVPWGNHL